MVVPELSAHGAGVRALQSKRVQNIELVPDGNTRAVLLVRLHFEAAVVVIESVTLFVAEQWKDSLFHYMV